MKTISRILFLALAASFVFTSCKKDKEDPNAEPKFSTYTPAENKSNMEQAGISLINEMNDLTDATAIIAAENLGNLTSGQAKAASDGIGVVKALSIASQNPSKLKAFLEDGPVTVAMDDIEGIYTWNATTGDFDQTTANNKVEFIFPYDDASTTNDCKLSLVVVPVAVSGELIPELTEAASSVSMTLVVKGSQVSSLTLTADYSSKGIPSNFQATLMVDTYKWQFTAAQSSKEVSSDFLFAHGASTLLNYGFKVGGNLDLDDVQAYVDKVDEMDAYVDGTITEAGTHVQDVKFYFQVMDVKLVETANTQEIAKSIEAIAKKYGAFDETTEMSDADDKAAQEEVLALVNDKVSIYLMYASSNTKIADVEFYLKDVQYEEYDWITGETYMVDDTELMPRFVFGENESPVDADAYFQEGFDDFEAEMENMITNIEDMMSSF